MVEVLSVAKGSPGHRHGIKAKDIIISINGSEVSDVLDYRFYTTEQELDILISRKGKELLLIVYKDEYEDLGLEFCSYLMDEKKSCKNNCIFCFIDQNPKGMRETIYFKDDDERLSFLQGNYITLTNLTQKEIDRIISMRISPINISVHTTDPILRTKIMRCKDAGDSLRYIKELDDKGIVLNTQLVLCHGINDGAHLERSLADLSSLYNINSIAVVPCGLTGHRQGLFELTPFDKDSAKAVLDITEKYGDQSKAKRGFRLVYASDEFFITAAKDIPDEEYYEDYPQLENGVGMLRSHYEEFVAALERADRLIYNKKSVIVTGQAAYSHIQGLCRLAKQKFPDLNVRVKVIKNDFFGGYITVTGLITGGDIIKQLSSQGDFEDLLIPANMLRHGEDMFLDDTTIEDIEKALSVNVVTVDLDGGSLLKAIIGDRG